MGPYYGHRMRCLKCGYEEPIRSKWDTWEWVDWDECSRCKEPSMGAIKQAELKRQDAARHDPNAAIVARVLQRALEGERKYGVGMTRHDLAPAYWLQEAIDEALDLAVYLEKLKETFNDRDSLQVRDPRG